MDVIANLPPYAQSAEPVQQCDGLFDDPAVDAQTGAVFGAASGELGPDPLGSHKITVFVVVVGPVGIQRLGAAARSTALSPHWWDRLDQREELGDVMSLPTGEGGCQRHAATISDHVVFRPSPGAIYRAGTGFGPPFNARTCEPSTAARDQSIIPAECNSANNLSCNRCHTPASVQSRRRRQQVIPEPYPSSWGRNSHGMPVYSTNKIPHNALRSSNRLRPGFRKRRCTTGNNGSIRSHSPSSTSHGLRCATPTPNKRSNDDHKIKPHRRSFC